MLSFAFRPQLFGTLLDLVSNIFSKIIDPIRAM
jgi:hypothetical protein